VLTSFDDYPIHQASVPVAHSATGDLNQYDRYFFNGYSRDGSLYFAAAMGLYPNRHVADAAFSVLVDGRQHSVFRTQRAPHDRRDATTLGPIVVEVVQPLQTLRVLVNAPEHGLRAELLFEGRSAALEEPHFFQRIGARTWFDYTRLTQFGAWTGWVEVDGARQNDRQRRTRALVGAGHFFAPGWQLLGSAGRDLAVTVRSEGNVRLFLIGGRGVFGLTVADLDQGSPATLEQVVTETVALLEQAIRETREQRSLPDLLKALATSAVATLLLVLLLVVLERLRRWGSRKATEKAHERLGAMRIPGKGLLEKDRLYFVTTRVLLLLTRAVDLLAIYVWFTFVLERFAWSRPWGEQLGSWLLGTTGRLGMSALGAMLVWAVGLLADQNQRSG
jgi:hypothetical protein